MTDVRAAKHAGYDGIELWMPKLFRYLDAGYTLNDLARTLGGLRVTMLDVLMPIERMDRQFRRVLLDDCARSAAAAQHLGCPAIQVVALDDFPVGGRTERTRVMVDSLSELAGIAEPHGVRLALEPVSFSPFHRLPEVLDVLEEVGRERVGLVLDTWHLWTSGTSWAEVAGLDPALIVCVQIGDTGPMSGPQWRDADRTALPGDGLIPLTEAVDAIRSTGFQGDWSIEMLSARHWEWEPQVLAADLLRRAGLLFDGHPVRNREI
ncbi:sugar phosphate isomerase/epimerase family protein [Streptomyces chartreusis]